MKVGCVYSPVYLKHDTGQHCENAERLEAIISHLEQSGLKRQLELIKPRAASIEELSLVHNERTKLTATWLNTLATALVAAGTFGPFAAQLYGLSSPVVDRILLAALAGICFVGGLVLHLGGRVFLGKLRA